MPAVQIAVCGPRECTEAEAENARIAGALLAEAGVTVLCGGGDGVMAAVAAGASAAGGLVIGIRPDDDPATACAGLSAVIRTNMGEARNAILVSSADAVIVIGGSWGTLSEFALAHRRGTVPVITLGGWQVSDSTGAPVPDPSIIAHTPAQAVQHALSRIAATESQAHQDNSR
ncbi:LOG family protein [Nocardia miyunensis]|uniref:SLOG cluster 4 domain-containing protein n=1 Tax=Nocardia miyunensis TaxID=282684 RepID=UPI0008367012|nr:LOG family protein [Nocardia miyunensis]